MKMIKRRRKLHPAARHVGVFGLGGDDRGRRNLFRWLAHDNAVGGHPAGGNRGLRAGAALEQAARDQEAIGTFPHGHGRFIAFPGRGAARSIAK
jgi:hypothetical protein